MYRWMALVFARSSDNSSFIRREGTGAGSQGRYSERVYGVSILVVSLFFA